MQGARDGAGGDHQAEVVAQQPGHLAMRQAQLLVEDDDQGDGPRAKLHCGSPQGVRGLQGMASLDPAPTLRAVADPDVETAHDRRHDRQVFLKLHRHACRGHSAGTVRTHRRHWHWDDLVHVRGRWPVPVASMAGPGAAPAPPRPGRRRALRERGRLAFARPACQIELPLQPVVLSAQPVPFSLQLRAFAFCPLQVTTQPVVLSFKVAGRGRSIRHIEVMPDSGKKYKLKMCGMEGQTR